ncbi:MAG: hypothetical protein V2I40_07185, partial [Desulfobacteraceae bacterium]|nr:hypothetical protein [Desulfobacteraceae bacterium]
MTISKIGTARYCLTLFCFLIYLTACSFNQAHGTDNSPDIKSSVGPSAMNCDIPITGQQKSYAHGDDGDLGMGTPWPTPRLIDNGDGTVSDRLTGLMWTKNADPTDGVIDWEDAV